VYALHSAALDFVK